MDRCQLLLAALLSITYCVYAQQGQHTVVAMVVGKGGQKLPEIKVNGVQMQLHSPQKPGALVQGSPSDTATYIVGNKASDSKPNHPVMAAALVMPSAPKPKPEHEKIMDELKLTKEEKKKLFPCEDYQPYCKNYAITNQCRDVWTQKNCRKSCKLCDVPYGVFIGCQDLDICKKFATTACMVRWVRETCKSKCSQCVYERQANSNIVMGKKRHFPVAKPKQSDQIKKKNNDMTKKVQKVLRKIAEKGKDELRKAAVKIQKIKQDIPKQTYKIKTNDEPESTILKPEITVDEKAVPKDKEDDSEESGDELKVASENNDESDTDSDDDDDSGDEDSEDEDDSGSSQDEDDDEEDKAKASGAINAPSNSKTAPIKMDEDPRGEPVVAKMVQQPIKFNDSPGKNMKIVKQKIVAKDAQPKVVAKKVSKEINNDKDKKMGKHVKKVQKS